MHGLQQPLSTLTGVGPALEQKFAQLGISTVGDLLLYFPRRYDDYSQVTPVGQLRPGMVTVQGVIENCKGRYVRRGMHITEADLFDGTDRVRLVWFNQPYRASALKPEQTYFVAGVYQLSRQKFSIVNPACELVSDFPVNTARIIPIYREVKGLTSRQIRKVIGAAMPMVARLPEFLPVEVIASEKGIMPRAQAVAEVHFPSSPQALEAARQRLGFEEVFCLVLASLLNKHELLADAALAIPFQQKLAQDFVKHLPFTLTDAQRKVIWHIYQDMQKTQPMNRLIEGDVGSGKTVVAAMAALMPIAEGFQVAYMAPTELLARQHANTIHQLLQPLGQEGQVALLTGGIPAKQKQDTLQRIARGEVRFIIGTHALIQEKVDMHKLGLVIIDEQHRFGVEQRKKLMSKAGHMPHLLSLTATPIPRSLALTLYGELDISIIDTKPAGRKPIITEVTSPNSRKQLYARITKELERGRQMFVVCPLITESAALQASSAEQVYEDMQKRDFKQWRVGLLHGKMKSDEKTAIMEAFSKHELDILVSTTVIEVGVDVPNASIMLIEAAERFGLAQIHQLRGRVGRGQDQGYCYLMMSDSKTPPQRLQALERITDGFALAEMDLELRGPGAIYGTMQHGALDLRIAKLSDTKLIARARQAAEAIIDNPQNLVQYTELFSRVQALRAVTNLN